jgi:serine/threonine protein kinase
MEETRGLLILSHLFKLGLLTRKQQEALEERVRGGLRGESLRELLIQEYRLDRATLTIMTSSVDSALNNQQRITRVERKGGTGGDLRPVRPDSTGVRRKLQDLDASPQDDLANLSPPDLAARYSILEMVGVGGIGVVHLARDSALKRKVAIKTLRPEFRGDPTWIKSLMYEAVITGNLEHPSIIPVYDLGVLPTGDFFYSMKFLQGPTLRDVIDHALEAGAGHGEAGLVESILQFRQICSGMDYAHSRGVVHRDLKPSNIHVGGHGEVYVMDWGISMGIQGDWPRWWRGPGGERAIGTYEYSAPEQILDESVPPSFEADVYSLGVILFELLTLQLPYGACHSREDVETKTRRPPPLPSSVAPLRVRPGVLDGICLRAMSPDPANRYRSVHEIVAEIDHFIAGTRERKYLEQLSRQEQKNAESLLKGYSGLLAERAAIRASVGQMRGQVNLLVSEDIRREIARMDNRVKNIDALLGQWYAEILAHLNRAQGYTPDAEAVLGTLFRLYRTRLEESRRQLDSNATIYYGNLALGVARKMNDEPFAAQGALSVRSFPEGAEIAIASYQTITKDARFEDGRNLGKTPLMDLPLPAGSYLVMARKPGFQDEHRFVFLMGGEKHHLLVTLAPLNISLGEGGREREIHDLQLYFQDAVNQNRMKVALLSGGPGSGIQHISNAFKNFLEGLPYYVAFIAVDCRAIHAQIPFYVISDMIKFRSGIRHGDRKEEVRKKLQEMLLVPLSRDGKAPVPRHKAERLPELVDLVGALPSIDLPASEATAALRKDPSALRQRIMWALGEYFQSLADCWPMVVILNNAQWIDPSSLEFLSMLRAQSRGRPIFVIGLMEGRAEDLPATWERMAVDRRITLERLDSESMERTITKLLNGAPAPELTRFLLERSGGLPYVTEFLASRLIRDRKLYQRHGDGEWVHKKTASVFPVFHIDDVISAQVHDLTPDEAAVVRAASVVGRVFWKEALDRLLPECRQEVLLSLVQKRWIHEHAHSRYPTTEEYTFGLDLLQERVYAEIPGKERRALHLNVAAWLWAKFRGSLEEVSLLGHHNQRGGETPEAGIFFQRVGDTCLRYDAREEALANYRRVLAIKVDPQRRREVEARVRELGG